MIFLFFIGCRDRSEAFFSVCRRFELFILSSNVHQFVHRQKMQVKKSQ